MRSPNYRKPVQIRLSNGEVWSVPRGFGAAYEEVAAEYLGKSAAGVLQRLWILRDILSLVGYTANVEQMATWSLRQWVEAHVYASIDPQNPYCASSPITRPIPTPIEVRP